VFTEPGAVDLTEQGVMALSGHKTPQAARLLCEANGRAAHDGCASTSCVDRKQTE